MQFDFLPDWIYTFLILPIVVLFQRQFALSSRVTVLESEKKIIESRLDDIENKIDNLCEMSVLSKVS